MTTVIAAVLVAHGFAHLAGFAWPWWLFDSEPARPSVATWLGDGIMAVLTTAWLVVAIAFVVAAIAVLRHRPVWRRIAGSAGATSLVLSVLCLPGSVVGVPTNLALLFWLWWTRRPSLAASGR